MAAVVNEHYFVEWKEQYVSKEKGNRVVHYFLKDNVGESILAVVGTERSVRHMFYVLSEEFLRVHGEDKSLHSGYRWRSRREVVNWLTSMLSKQHMQGRDYAMSPNIDRTIEVNANMPAHKSHLARNVKSCHLGIKWSGTPWTCSKQLKHYPSFSRNGISVPVQSFVFVMAEEENQYIAYLEDMYEDRKLMKKVKVRWFHDNREVKGAVSLKDPHPKEVFITPYVQVISAECVDGPAIVLTHEHYEKCLAVFPRNMLGRVHFCFRQFKSNRLKPFKLTKLHGYFRQSIFSCFSADFFEEDEFSSEDDVKMGGKRSRSSSDNQKATYELPDHKLKHGSVKREGNFPKQVESRHMNTPSFNVNENLEYLSLDSGLRGCWFRCRVIELSRKRIKIVHGDIIDEDSKSNLEEWIRTDEVAMADKLGMRRPGRPTIRPAYPRSETGMDFEVGDPVDAWWSDGWWEGVITADNKDGNYQIYVSGEKLYINIDIKNLRVSKDWIGNRWVDIKPNPNILDVISSVENNKLSTPTEAAVSEETKLDSRCHKIVTSQKPIEIPDLEGMTLTNVPLKDECAYNEQQHMLEADGKEYNSEPVNEEDDDEEANMDNDWNAKNCEAFDGRAKCEAAMGVEATKS